MAILVIRVRSNEHPTDPALTLLRTQRGDVVEIVEDGHVFSQAERDCGHYRFVRVSDVAAGLLAHLKEPRLDADGITIIRRRHRTLDFTALAGLSWRDRLECTRAEIEQLVVLRD